MELTTIYYMEQHIRFTETYYYMEQTPPSDKKHTDLHCTTTWSTTII